MRRLTTLFVLGGLTLSLLSATSWAGEEDWQSLFMITI